MFQEPITIRADLITEEEKIPIMALPVTLGADKAKLIDQLLSLCLSLLGLI